MFRHLLTLGLFAVAASLSALTVQWQVPNSGYTEGTGESAYRWINDASVYFVYSEAKITGDFSQASTVSALYDAANKTAPSGATTAEATMTEITVAGQKGISAVFNGLTKSETAEGYYYLVVFNSNSSSSEYGQYAIAGGVQPKDANSGIYETAYGGNGPEVGDYIYIGDFLGGTWSKAINAPEPTAIALLALGVAALALRRKTL